MKKLFINVDEAKRLVDNGVKVFWSNELYELIKKDIKEPMYNEEAKRYLPTVVGSKYIINTVESDWQHGLFNTDKQIAFYKDELYTDYNNLFSHTELFDEATYENEAHRNYYGEFVL